jgi:uncharacterized membrane protein YfcA
MGVLLDESLQRINGLKNVLAAMVNGIAALFFVVIAHMDWVAVALVAAGATIGGLIGARVGRRLPPMALRGLIVAVGIAAIVQLLLK